MSIAIAATGFALAALAATAPGANGASSGIRYDQLVTILKSDQPTPQPGGFPGRFQAAVNAMRPSHHGLFASIQNMAQMATAVTKTGLPTTEYYMGEWTRTDDPAKQTATIYRPDRHQIIHLDLAKKTYTIEDLTSPTQMAPPAPGAPQPQGTRPPEQPGTGRIDITNAGQSLGAKTIDGEPTTGYSEDFKMVSSQSTGSCKDGTVEASIVQYISNYAEVHPASMPAAALHPEIPSPEMMAQSGGCRPKIAYHNAGSVSVPGGRISLWTLTTFKGSAPTQQGQMGGGIATLTERGDVQTLGPGDAGLFDVPPGFTKES